MRFPCAMVTYEDVYTCGAVKRWSLARRSAWKGRAANPNECLYRLPVPGERLATGAFTDAETSAFDRRLAEFQARGWPLSCWGLFSLALPHRVGYQCSQHYAKRYGAGAGNSAKPSAAAVAACQWEMASDVAAAFAAPAAKRLAAAVNKWLAEVEEAQTAAGAPAVAKTSGQQQRLRGRPSSRRGDSSSWESDSDFENDPHNSSRGGNAGLKATAAARQQQQQQQQQQQDGALPPQAQERTQRTQLWAAALPPPLQEPPPSPRPQQQQQQQPGLRGAGTQQAAAARQERTAGAAVGAVPAPSARPQAPQQSGLQQTQQHHQQRQRVVPRPMLAGQKRPQRPPVAPPAAAANAKKARPAFRAASHSKPPRFQAGVDDSSSEDEFVAGSLRQAPMPSMPAAMPAQQAGKKSGGRGRPGASMAAAAAACAHEGFGERVEVIRLDTTEPSRWPGWQASVAGIRRVVPYQVALPPAAAAIQPGCPVAQQPAGGAVVHTQDLLSFDLSRLGGGFLGVLLQLGDSLPPDRPAASPAAADAAGAAPAAEQAAHGAGSGPQALSWQRLAACLRLGGGVLPCGLVFVWACKASVAPAVRLLCALGCKYVENLTWVQLGTDNRPLLRPGPLFNGSHATLLLGRRGDEKRAHLELRHQRTPDVIISPALRPGACPEAVYSMIETLLPDAGAAAKIGGQARLLELAFTPAGGPGPGGRPGWVTVAQTQGASPA